ncbi:MAG TPA: polysaccharide deacetylase family protein, partial [Chitinophagaceae bacterium]|nr:polysaccharide deacetylase family protein [Chitinophagaceae bacterium]
MESKKQHAFTLSIDWEDFGQLLGRDRTGVLTGPLPKTIDRQTDIMLEMLNETGKKATFFILGMLAQHRPDLVKKIAAEGHEIGLHGQYHINMRKLTRQQAYDDINESKKLVTDIIGGPVYGYRAPYFSIDESNLYVLEVLAELGLIYDSSIFPIKLKRYGIANFNKTDTLYSLPNGREIVELPLTVAPFNGRDIAIAGGGYMRAFPKFFLNKMFRKLDNNQQNVMLYMHPYEFDTKRIDCSTNYPATTKYSKTKTFLINLRWNLFRNS